MSFNPQTPQSPSQFSPSTADHPPSLNSSMASSTTTLPTPAHSVNGHSASENHDVVMADDFTQKRKRPDEDGASLDQKKVHLEDPRRLGIENLHLDVGEKYLLCRTPHSVAYPNMCQDLFEVFDLATIATDYARVKPNGEKNALRKTYKGQMKQLGVNGHFDSVRKEVDDPKGFFVLLNTPESDWHSLHVQGKEIERGLSDMVLQSALAKATVMAKGPIPKAVWDSSVLGDLAPSNVQKKSGQDTPGSKTKGPATPATGIGAKASALDVPQGDRGRRNIKKRSYQDSSFEGYSETFQDDEGGYSTGGDDRSNTLKRRKQNPSSGSPLNGGSRSSYGGMVGV